MQPQPGEPSQPLAPVLIVDDNEAIRGTIQLLLEEEGYSTLEARNGTDTLVLLRESPEPLVVLLDARMPELSGEEVLRTVLGDRQLRRRHTFILLSALLPSLSSLRMQRLLRALAVEVVTKPFDVADLEQAVVRAQQRQHSAALASS